MASNSWILETISSVLMIMAADILLGPVINFYGVKLGRFPFLLLPKIQQ
jgi:hypothetical protein